MSRIEGHQDLIRDDTNNSIINSSMTLPIILDSLYTGITTEIIFYPFR